MKKMKHFLICFSLTIIFSSFSIPLASALLGENEAMEKYSIYQLDLDCIDNYILLRFWGEEAYKVYANQKLCKNSQVQNIYSYLKQNLTGNESEMEVYNLFQEVTYREALSMVAKGAPASELVAAAPNTLEALGVNMYAYHALSNKEAVVNQLSNRTFSSLQNFAQELSTLLDGISPQNTTALRSVFTDVPNGEMTIAVNALADAEIVNGKSNTIFAPNDYITRAEFTKMLVLALDIHDESATVDFADVQNGGWYYPYISVAAQENLIQGYDGVFGVDNHITKQEAAVILYRALTSNGIELSDAGSESGLQVKEQVDDYAAEAVARLAASGISKALIEDKSTIKDFATRGQVAQAIYEMIQLLEGDA